MIDYQAVIADLESKRRVINARFDAAVAAIRQVLALEGMQPVLPGIIQAGAKLENPARQPYRGMGLVEAAMQHLTTAPGPVPNIELARALEEGGFQHKSKNFPNTLNSVLRRRAMAKHDLKKGPKGWTLSQP